MKELYIKKVFTCIVFSLLCIACNRANGGAEYGNLNNPSDSNVFSYGEATPCNNRLHSQFSDIAKHVKEQFFAQARDREPVILLQETSSHLPMYRATIVKIGDKNISYWSIWGREEKPETWDASNEVIPRKIQAGLKFIVEELSKGSQNYFGSQKVGVGDHLCKIIVVSRENSGVFSLLDIDGRESGLFVHGAAPMYRVDELTPVEKSVAYMYMIQNWSQKKSHEEE